MVKVAEIVVYDVKVEQVDSFMHHAEWSMTSFLVR